MAKTKKKCPKHVLACDTSCFQSGFARPGFPDGQSLIGKYKK
jgi:hypothetical protein